MKNIKTAKAITENKSTQDKDSDGDSGSGSDNADDRSDDMQIIISLFLSHMVGVGIIVSQLMPMRKYIAALLCTIFYDVLLVSFFLHLDRKRKRKQKQKQKEGTAAKNDVRTCFKEKVS